MVAAAVPGPPAPSSLIDCRPLGCLRQPSSDMPAKPVGGGRWELWQQDACRVQSPAEHASGLHQTHMQAEYVLSMWESCWQMCGLHSPTCSRGSQGPDGVITRRQGHQGCCGSQATHGLTDLAVSTALALHQRQSIVQMLEIHHDGSAHNVPSGCNPHCSVRCAGRGYALSVRRMSMTARKDRLYKGSRLVMSSVRVPGHDHIRSRNLLPFDGNMMQMAEGPQQQIAGQYSLTSLCHTGCWRQL